MNRIQRIEEEARYSQSLMDLSREELEAITVELYMATIPHKIRFKCIDDKVHYIINSVCEHLSQNKSDIVGRGRKKEYVFARHLAMELIMHYAKLSQTKTGSYFSNRDHSSVHHARACIRDYETSVVKNCSKRDAIKYFREDFDATL